MTDLHTAAMKIALQGAANYIDTLGGDSRKYRQALANEALDKMAENAREIGLDYTITQTGVGIGKRAEEAYEAAKERGWVGLSDHRLMEQPAQEPVACANGCRGFVKHSQPAQRTWVGLTDEELSEVYNQADWDTVNGWEYERAIEAKLKEKNT